MHKEKNAQLGNKKRNVHAKVETILKRKKIIMKHGNNNSKRILKNYIQTHMHLSS